MDSFQQSDIILFLGNLFSSPDPAIRKDAECKLNIMSNMKDEDFCSMIMEIILSKDCKGMNLLSKRNFKIFYRSY